MDTFSKAQRNRQQSTARDESLSHPCAYCGAPVGEPCTSGGRVYFGFHRCRRPHKTIETRPEFISWWKEQRAFEGQYAKSRPANYRVPSQAELVAGAA